MDNVERDFWGRTMLEHLTCNRFHTPENFDPRPVGKRYSGARKNEDPHMASMPETATVKVNIEFDVDSLSTLKKLIRDEVALIAAEERHGR